MFSRKTVKIEQFTAELFGFHAADHRRLSNMTKSFDESLNLEFDLNRGSEQQQSYLELSTQSINVTQIIKYLKTVSFLRIFKNTSSKILRIRKACYINILE